jgi:hypothetical protein
MADSRRTMPFLASAIALSHPDKILSQSLNFSLDLLSRLLNNLRMASSSEYRRAYDATQQELIDLLGQQEKLAKRIVVVRQNLKSLAELCENEAIPITPSLEAKYLLDKSSLADEILDVLRAEYPEWLRPSDVKQRLIDLGHDMNSYLNGLATIHMILKRHKSAEKVRERIHPQGFKVYQYKPRTLPRLDGQVDPHLALQRKKK